MPDEASTPPDSTGSPQVADTQAPPSEPAPAPEPVTTAPSPETAQPEIAPTPEASQTESALEAPSGAVEPPRASKNLEAVINTTSQNTPPVTPEQTAQTVPAHSSPTVIRPSSSVQDYGRTPHGDLAAANAKIQETKRKNLDKIMTRLSEKGRITNDEVEKLLRVSDATATRYLQTLEQENRIKQTGKTGTGVFYEKM